MPVLIPEFNDGEEFLRFLEALEDSEISFESDNRPVSDSDDR